MSVYIRKDTKDGKYEYDFQFKGQRHTGSTGKTRRREAEAEEQRLRDEARRAWEKRQAVVNAGPDMTIEQACERYWEEKELDHVEEGRADTVRHLAWIVEHFGPGTKLSAIGDAAVVRMVAARRGDYIPNRKERKRICNTTVNTTATLPLRRVMNRASLVWKVPLQIINWKEHILPTSDERVRELRLDEEAALFDNLERGYEDLATFSKIMGARRSECLNLKQTDIDWINNRVRLTGKGSRGKGPKIVWLPMPPEVRELLWTIRNNHPVMVFTYVASSTRRLNNGETIVRGQRFPITKYSLRREFDKKRNAAGVADFRFHDLRHTAATRLLRRTGNLKLVQKQLRHADIGTTAKYAHVFDEDLAEAMAAAYPARRETAGESPAESPAEPRDLVAKRLI
jgi:integrase